MHPLDHPIWSALTTTQSHLAQVRGAVRRLAPEYGHFAAGDLTALGELPVTGDGLYVMTDAPIAAPVGFAVANQAPCAQMVADSVPDIAPDTPVAALGEADAADMRHLAALTKPGPFSTATHRLGQFYGIRHEGHLVAMVGERLRPAGHAEVSGVCVHPDYRGRGYARLLSSIVARGIIARGDKPVLHVYADNAPAIAVYESLNFRRRRLFSFVWLKKLDAA